MTTEYTVTADRVLTEPGLNITRFTGRPQRDRGVRLALSGGGSRAATVSLGPYTCRDR